jgi:hypothetical protein
VVQVKIAAAVEEVTIRKADVGPAKELTIPARLSDSVGRTPDAKLPPV